jgi:hypothetical protein
MDPFWEKLENWSLIVIRWIIHIWLYWCLAMLVLVVLVAVFGKYLPRRGDKGPKGG